MHIHPADSRLVLCDAQMRLSGARMIRLLFTSCLIVLALASRPAQAAQDDIYGVWRNPKDTVHVDIRPCGTSACGVVVWASPKAQAAAKKGSGKELVGQQLLRDFAPYKGGWKGKVFVPDINKTLTGTARLSDGQHMEAQGCLLLFCKKQVWTRIQEG
jgi:uncharacterized protein (DUF2147 family)